jgi:hypothetical protein
MFVPGHKKLDGMKRAGVLVRGVDEAELGEQIKWWDVLDAVFTVVLRNEWRRVRECRHPDAQWLASLVPDDSMGKDDLGRVLLAQGEDRRALFLVGCLDHAPALLHRAAELGYPPALTRWSSSCVLADDIFSLVEKAWAGGDRNATYRLGNLYRFRSGCEHDMSKAVALWKEAAEVSHVDAQNLYGTWGFGEDDPERFVWWGRAAAGGSLQATLGLLEAARPLLVRRDKGCDTGCLLFHICAALDGGKKVEEVLSLWGEGDDAAVAKRCVALHKQWVACARAAIACWLAAGRRLGAARDIRLLISRLLWEERAEWCRIQVR